MNNSKVFNRSTYQDTSYETNFDKIVNQTTLKIKEFTNKKLDLQKQNGLLKGQRNTIQTDINHLQNTTNQKETSLASLVYLFSLLLFIGRRISKIESGE